MSKNKSMGLEDEHALTSVLESDERLLWSGQPRQGIMFRPADVFLLTFGFMWSGFAIFWEWNVLLTEEAPFFFKLWGIPFLLYGLHLMVGRFLLDAKQREKTYYGLTSKRILIVSSGRVREVKSFDLRTITDLSSTAGDDGQGSIYFGAPNPLDNPLMWWVGNYRQSPRFEQIQNVMEVYKKISSARHVTQ